MGIFELKPSHSRTSYKFCLFKELNSKWQKISLSYPLTDKMRFPVSFSDKDISYYLKMLKGETEEENKLRPVLKSVPEKGVTILLRSQSIGRGDEQYSQELLYKFIFALTKALPKPKMIIAINEAVKIMCNDSPALESLKILEKQGVKIIISNPCSEFYKCVENINIGSMSDIHEITSYLIDSSRVITL